jgi:hypothetical protein
MSVNPPTLVELGNYWVKQGGTNLGVVGNAAHTSGYHLGKDRIVLPDYSVSYARDKAGFSNAASAIDLGRLNGSLANLRKFSVWLVAELKSSPALRYDFREIIYSPDGVKVQRYSAVDNAIHTGPGNGDSSHITHTHISYIRDSERRSKLPAFEKFFESPPVTGDVPMPSMSSYTPGYDAVLKATSNVRNAPKLTAPVLRVVGTAKETWDITGWVLGDVDPEGGSNQWVTRWSGGRWEYSAKSNVVSLTPPATGTGDVSGPALATCIASLAAANAEVAAAKAKTVAAEAALVGAQSKATAAEASRLAAVEVAAKASDQLLVWAAYKAAHTKVGL